LFGPPHPRLALRGEATLRSLSRFFTRLLLGLAAPGYFLALPWAIVTFFITTSVAGLSRGPRSTPAILVTRESGAHLPKIVWRRLRWVGVPSVMKNCDPLVAGPALAMARIAGLSKVRSGAISSAKR